jgi:hypothetical protein
MFTIQSKMDESTTLIEELLQLSAEIGAEGAVLFGGVFILYVVGGAVTTTLLKLKIPYPIFSVETDPVLLITGTIVGVFTVQAAGSLLLYHFHVGVKRESVSSVMLSLIALGVGGALLRTTVPQTWEILTTLV